MGDRDIYWEWYCSLFPKTQKTKIDPTLQKCKCGHQWKFNKWQLIRMLLQGKYIHTCPQCLERKEYRLIYHVVMEKVL